MSTTFVALLKQTLRAWREWWERLQGPELEPRLWHSHFLSAFALRKALYGHCRGLAGQVLDIGAGTGLGGMFLDPLRTEYLPTDLPTGRDADDHSITVRGERPKVYCNGYALPFRSEAFDAVLAHSLLEHVAYPDKILREAFRVLAGGGTLVISVPYCFPVHGLPDDFRRWTPQGLKLEAELAGYEVIHTVNLGNAFHALALNWNLLWRYGVPSSSKALYVILTLAAPLVILSQLIANTMALVLGSLDRDTALPIGVGLVARKNRNQGAR